MPSSGENIKNVQSCLKLKPICGIFRRKLTSIEITEQFESNFVFVLNEIFFPHFVVENGCKHQCLDIKNVLI